MFGISIYEIDDEGRRTHDDVHDYRITGFTPAGLAHVSDCIDVGNGGAPDDTTPDAIDAAGRLSAEIHNFAHSAMPNEPNGTTPDMSGAEAVDRDVTLRAYIRATYRALEDMERVKNELIVIQNAIADVNFAGQIADLSDIEGSLRAARLDAEQAFGLMDEDLTGN